MRERESDKRWDFEVDDKIDKIITRKITTISEKRVRREEEGKWEREKVIKDEISK